jgi:hypothetical protein
MMAQLIYLHHFMEVGRNVVILLPPMSKLKVLDIEIVGIATSVTLIHSPHISAGRIMKM